MACPSDRHNTKITQEYPQDLNQYIDDLAAARKTTCDSCEMNDNGACRMIYVKHGRSKAVIDHGVRRLSSRCPQGKWLEKKITCQKCGRFERVNEEKDMCNFCWEKAAPLKRDRQRGREGNRVIVENPFQEDPVKHLHYFLYPRYEQSTDYHLTQLEKSLDVFNGKKVCTVAFDADTLQDHFKKRLEEIFTELIYVPNDSNNREKVGFVAGLRKMAIKRENHVICFAHGKGQQQHTFESGTVRKWCDAMYDTCLRNWSEVEDAMNQGFPVAGAFKSNKAFQTTQYKWHYSGAFWWARSQKLFENRLWKEMCNRWWGFESYVGRHFTRQEGYCLFRPLYAGESLYDVPVWDRVSKDLDVWRVENESFRKSIRVGL